MDILKLPAARFSQYPPLYIHRPSSPAPPDSPVLSEKYWGCHCWPSDSRALLKSLCFCSNRIFSDSALTTYPYKNNVERLKQKDGGHTSSYNLWSGRNRVSVFGKKFTRSGVNSFRLAAKVVKPYIYEKSQDEYSY